MAGVHGCCPSTSVVADIRPAQSMPPPTVTGCTCILRFRSLSLGPTGLADGLALKEQRYVRVSARFAPADWVPGSLALGQELGVCGANLARLPAIHNVTHALLSQIAASAEPRRVRAAGRTPARTGALPAVGAATTHRLWIEPFAVARGGSV